MGCVLKGLSCLHGGLHWRRGKAKELAKLLLTMAVLVPLVARCCVLISVEPIAELSGAVGALEVIPS